MLKRIALVTLLAATTALTGCANSDVYSGDVYTKDRAKQVQTVIEPRRSMLRLSGMIKIIL